MTMETLELDGINEEKDLLKKEADAEVGTEGTLSKAQLREIFDEEIVFGLMFINRNRNLLQQAAKRPISSFFAMVVAVLRAEVTIDSGKAVREIPRMMGAAIRGVAILMGTIFVSRILLGTFPTPQTFNQNLRDWMINDDFIRGWAFLLASMVALWIVCSEVAWRQMTRDQARIYLRSVLLLSHHADLE